MLSSLKSAAITVVTMLLINVQLARAQTEAVLYSFANSPDGATPNYVTPVFDKDGNLYGTTAYGGAYGFGTVFELSPSGTETILHSFNFNGTDGNYPYSGLVLDKKGNLYGTTTNGGTYALGTVFKLASSGTETILWSFGSGTDGHLPQNGLVLDSNGDLCGTTPSGGTYNEGTVFELKRSGKRETILHSFDFNGTDGYVPHASLVRDKEGNLYGTTIYGGAYCGYEGGCGTVFEVTVSGTETILHSFDYNGTDGTNPYASLIMDKEGNLYGTTSYGGTYNWGTVFELTQSGTEWTEKVLYSFGQVVGDGRYPYAGLIMDKKGNLYGTTVNGGTYNSCATGCGTVFKLALSGAETVLHSFGASGDGQNPQGGLVSDKEGNLYGTTSGGGAFSYGTVFKVTP
jgi:uncharacterized repeat protein (TIGR03803 family)